MSRGKNILVFKTYSYITYLFNKVNFGSSGVKIYLASSLNDSAVRF